jgi:hypothetical protein
MEQITAYILNLLEIIEKELKLLKHMTAKTLFSIGWFGMGVFLLGVGLIFLAWTCFTAVAMLVGPAWAGLAASVLLLLGGGVFLWIGKKNLK